MGGLSHKPLKYGINQPRLRAIAKKNEELDAKDVKVIVDKILHMTNSLVIKDVTEWIRRFVPKMTGRLRHDLWKHLLDSYVKDQVGRIIIKTSIDYAERVNSYQTHNVRHKGKRIKRHGRIIVLWDPQAIGGFFDAMVKYAKLRIKKNLQVAKNKVARKTKMKYKEINIMTMW